MPGPSIDRPAVERWFATKTGVGQTAARRFALVYELLATASAPEKPKASPTSAKPKPPARRKPSKKASEETPAKEAERPLAFSGLEPSIHIDIQIHISPDAKPDQIDQIFASMAKHLRNLRSGND